MANISKNKNTSIILHYIQQLTSSGKNVEKQSKEKEVTNKNVCLLQQSIL